VKLNNDYARALGEQLFADMPKTVLAAVAVSALTTGGEELSEAAVRVAREWHILHLNGIVPQKPSKRALQLAGETVDLMAALKKSLGQGEPSERMDPYLTRKAQVRYDPAALVIERPNGAWVLRIGTEDRYALGESFGAAREALRVLIESRRANVGDDTAKA
jgi:hypothetical protein